MKAQLVAVGTALLATGGLLMASPASAQTAPVLACGSTIQISCSQTAHYSDVNQWQTPVGPGAGCPDYLVNDYALMTGSGNGIEHANINKAGDFWATDTFAGQVTLTFYDPANVDVTVIDDNGDIVATPTGPSDDTISGHVTQWFGVSDNKQNGTFGFTFSFEGSDAAGNRISLNGSSHQNWTAGPGAFSGPPHHAKTSVHC